MNRLGFLGGAAAMAGGLMLPVAVSARPIPIQTMPLAQMFNTTTDSFFLYWENGIRMDDEAAWSLMQAAKPGDTILVPVGYGGFWLHNDGWSREERVAVVAVPYLTDEVWLVRG